MLSRSFVECVEDLATLLSSRFHEPINFAANHAFVFVVTDAHQVDKDIVPSTLNGRFQTPGSHLKNQK